jgi:uncharacterized membrane protein
MISFLIGFLVLICVIVCVGILVRWAIASWGLTIPGPLLAVAGIIVFLILLLMLLNYSHIYTFQLGR